MFGVASLTFVPSSSPKTVETMLLSHLLKMTWPAASVVLLTTSSSLLPSHAWRIALAWPAFAFTGGTASRAARRYGLI